MSPEAQARYWDDFMVRYLPTFRTSPFEQIGTYVKACWEAIVYTVEWSVKNGLGDVLAEIGPDLIVNDNVALYPDTQRAGCPWVRMISCSRERDFGSRHSAAPVRVRRERQGVLRLATAPGSSARSGPCMRRS